MTITREQRIRALYTAVSAIVLSPGADILAPLVKIREDFPDVWGVLDPGFDETILTLARGAAYPQRFVMPVAGEPFGPISVRTAPNMPLDTVMLATMRDILGPGQIYVLDTQNGMQWGVFPEPAKEPE